MKNERTPKDKEFSHFLSLFKHSSTSITRLNNQRIVFKAPAQGMT